MRKAVAQSAIPVSVDAAGSGSYINKRASDSRVNLSNLLLDCHSHGTVFAKVIFTIPLHFNAGEEVYTAEAQGMSRNQGYIHLQKWERKKKKQKWMCEKYTNLQLLKHLLNPDNCVLTVKSTKNLWFFSPTQLLTQGQWWSIFLIHLLQILHRGAETMTSL